MVLPVRAAARELLLHVRQATTLILAAETGSGKSTQLPQILREAGYATTHDHAANTIAVTQPRRVAASSIAARVAHEMAVELGTLVGYSVRFDERTSDATRLLYLTDGMLLRRAMADPLLRTFGVVLIDEAHERSLQTDIVLALLKRAQKARAASAAPLKLIVMSATLDVDLFCGYFEGAPAVQVCGRSHAVDVLYTAEPVRDYVEAACAAVVQVHTTEAEGDVLVFLTGEEDIESAHATLRRWCASPEARGWPPLLPRPLYAALAPAAQAEALARAPAGSRKAILATNIAETSLTIDGVVFVVDSGLVKTRIFDSSRGVDSLISAPISRSGARQRAGRAGRQSAGKCFRLYTEETFGTELADMAVPEVLRSSLASTVLALKRAGVDDVLGFDFIEPPPREALAAALEELLLLGALNEEGGLTADGHTMSALPVEPVHARALLAARDRSCLPQMVGLLSVYATDGALFLHRRSLDDNDDGEGIVTHAAFASPNGDATTAVAVLVAYFGIRNGPGGTLRAARRWCESHSLNWKALEAAAQIRAQLVASLHRLELSPSPEARSGAGGEEPLALTPLGVESGRELRRCLTEAFFTRAAIRQASGGYLALVSRQTVHVHPSSVLFSKRSKCVLYHELILTSRLYMRNVTSIAESWLSELAPQFYSAG